MSSRWKKVWADFWGNKTRTFLTILTIMVGTFAVGFNNNLKLYMSESMDSDYLSAKPSEATVYTSPLDDELVKMAREVPGVDAVEGRSTLSANVIHTDGKPISIRFTALEDPSNLTLNLLKPVEGESTLPPLHEKQILVGSSVSTLGYKPGDPIVIELSDGKRRTLTVGGFVHDVTGIPYGPYSKTITAYVTPDTIEWLGGSRSYNALAVSVAENQTDQVHVTAVAQAVADRMEKAGETVYSIYVVEPGHYFAWNVSQAIFLLIGVLGYMIIFLSIFLIVNTITALMAQHIRQIGIMKSVGARTPQIFGMYVILILAFGLLALLIAIPLANGAGQNIGSGMAEFLGFYVLPFKPYPQSIIQQVLVALFVPLLAVIWPVYNSARITIREALTNYGIGADTKPSDKKVGRIALLISRPMRLSLRNAFRRKTRLILTMVALVLGGSIFIGVYNVWNAFDNTIKDIQGYFLADINVTFERYYRYDEVASLALSVPGVSDVEGWSESTATLITGEEDTGTQIIFVAPPSTSTLIDPIIIAGRWLRPGDENAIVIGNMLLTMYPDLQIGDWLTIKINGKETEWQIVGFYTVAGYNGPPMLYTNYEYLSRVLGRPDQVYTLRVITQQHDASTQTRVADELRSFYDSNEIKVTNTETATDWYLGVRAITDVVIYFMSVMAVLIAVVGGLGLMGTMSINVMERTREIGVMRSIGASNRSIQSIVIVEGMVIGLISWLISILLSIPITGILTFGVGMAILRSPMNPTFNLSGIFYWLIFTLVLAAIASSLPAGRASRLTVRDTLAYE